MLGEILKVIGSAQVIGTPEHQFDSMFMRT
jgi:hypothetical protein